jgi:hypothetical protein
VHLSYTDSKVISRIRLHLLGQVLNKMPVRMAMLRSSGIAGTVSDRVASHPNRIVREAAARLAARWAGKPARPPAPAQVNH